MENIHDKDSDVTLQATSRDIGSFSHKPLAKVVVVFLLYLLIFASAIYVRMQLGKRTFTPTDTVSNSKNQLSQTLTPGNALPSEQQRKMETNTSITTDPPEKYGFTKMITLEGIGVRALFPPNVSVSLQEDNFYVVSMSESDQVTFALKSYDGGGRRAWFAKEYPGKIGYQLVSYAGTGHSGYMAYAVQEKDLPGAFIYLTVIGDRMLEVFGTNNPGVSENSLFFNKDIQRFKSFLSSIELISPVNTKLETYPAMSDLFRWSDTRKTIWEDVELGLKITAPDWTESRFTKGRDANGKFIYTEWTRAYPKAQTDSILYLSETVSRTQVIGGYMSGQFLTTLPARFHGITFSEVAHEALIAGGFCATEWRNSKDECTGQNYCYTKEEVIQHMYAKRNSDIGSLVAQLWSMDSDFSITNDCRSEEVWLIRAADGRYISSDIAPDGEATRLETL